MPITAHTETALVIDDKPWLQSLVGVLFIAGGVSAFAGGERVFGGGFALAGVGIIAGCANQVTSRFDRLTGRFTQSMRGLVRKGEVTHALADIVSVRVDASGGSGSSPSQSYRVVLVLKSRERVHVPSGPSSGKSDKERLAAEIRRFLNLAEVSQDAPAFGEMVKAMFTPATRERDR